MIYGYARVSSYKQLKSGNSLEDQINKLKARGCDVIIEEQFTATTIDRPKFKELLGMIKEGDTLMCTTLDRFARSTEEGIVLINKLLKEKKFIHILDLGFIEEGSLTHKILVPLLLSIAEMEREKIILRCRSGKEIAKTKKGFQDGRPKKFTKEQLDLAIELKKDNSYKQIEKMTGISKSTIVRAIREKNINHPVKTLI